MNASNKSPIGWAVLLAALAGTPASSGGDAGSALPSPGGGPGPLELRLRADMEDGSLDDFSRVEAAFILSGVETSDSLAACTAWFDGLVATVEAFRLPMTDRLASARSVFMYLHSAWLKKYETEATTLLHIRNSRTFNCVSGTLCYNLLCERLGWSPSAFETPTHVYTIFDHFGERVPVENTSSMGFDIMRNLQEYSRLLARFYPENKAVRIGLDRLYAYENSRGRDINNTELLGLLAYNRAYASRKAGDFDRAFDHVRFARMFNRDSRSNVDFEIGLYFEWGKKLFDRGDMAGAFEVCAEGFSRYPDVPDFRKNTRAVFFSVAQTASGWAPVKLYLDRVLDLSVLGPEDTAPVRSALRRLAAISRGRGREDEVTEIQAYDRALDAYPLGSEN